MISAMAGRQILTDGMAIFKFKQKIIFPLPVLLIKWLT
jgi:hypothetical protein